MNAKGLVPGQVSRLRSARASPGASRCRAWTCSPTGWPKCRWSTEPGTRWSYSMGLDLMGRVIEVVSGQPFDVPARNDLSTPAGMTSTCFQVPRGRGATG